MLSGDRKCPFELVLQLAEGIIPVTLGCTYRKNALACEINPFFILK